MRISHAEPCSTRLSPPLSFPKVLNKITIDNTAGDALGSDGKTIGHNSDCFDVSASDVTIQNSSCKSESSAERMEEGSAARIDYGQLNLSPHPSWP